MKLNHKYLIVSFILALPLTITSVFAQAQENEANSDLMSTVNHRDQARQILLDPQKLIDECKSYYSPGIEAYPWSPMTQVSQHLFHIAEARGDEDFLDVVLMTYIHLGLEEIDYNYLFTFSPPREYLPLENTFCEDYIHIAAIEAAANINDDERRKQRFEEFKNLDHSWVPHILISRIDDIPYVLDQIHRQANRNISPEEAGTSDHAISHFVRSLPSRPDYYKDRLHTIVNSLAHSAVNPLIRLAALQTTHDSYILSWHATHNPALETFRERRNPASPQAISFFYIPEDEEVMEMYKNAARERIFYLESVQGLR